MVGCTPRLGYSIGYRSADPVLVSKVQTSAFSTTPLRERLQPGYERIQQSLQATWPVFVSAHTHPSITIPPYGTLSQNRSPQRHIGADEGRDRVKRPNPNQVEGKPRPGWGVPGSLAKVKMEA